MSIRQRIDEAFAPRAIPADPPAMPARAHLMQVPSDRLRDLARQFVITAVGLVPDPQYHELLVDVVHDIVVAGERMLERVLEGREDFGGHKLRVQHAPYLTDLGEWFESATTTIRPMVRDEMEKQAPDAEREASSEDNDPA